ncbi:MAG: hypothetical protein GF320_04305, partial [Armatimonadia bacterium]|nr:hypothetical protein [Armatimonadia bacterium]
MVLVVGALVPAVVWVRQSSWGRLLGIAPPPESVWIDEERKTVPPYELPPAPDPNALEMYDQGTAALGEPASIGELAREEPWVEEWRQGIARGEYESLTPHLPKVRDIHESNTEALALLHEARGMDAANTQPPDYQADRGYLAERRELARAAATAIQLYSV